MRGALGPLHGGSAPPEGTVLSLVHPKGSGPAAGCLNIKLYRTPGWHQATVAVPFLLRFYIGKRIFFFF